MKKIEVREYAPVEQLVIVYTLDNTYEDDGFDVVIDNDSTWTKVDLYDPMLKYNSNVNVGYRGEGHSLLAKIIVETFRDYPSSSREYVVALKRVTDYLASLDHDNNNAIKTFNIIENDIKDILDV